MIEIFVKNNSDEAFNKAFGIWKKECDKAGFIQEIRNRQYFKSPSEKLREKRRKNKHNKEKQHEINY